MDNKKICFISCVNNQELYKKSLFCINNLEVPKGFKVEIICIENTKCLTKEYNKAMRESDAKYKVYLHQDIFIINKNFINDIINIFNSNKNIGMIGNIGSKEIPVNGMWWKSNSKYGKLYIIYKDEEKVLEFNEPENEYENVKCIDGSIMITQYDVQWRDDILKGRDFYDISQSIEFKKKGYEVIIPKQDKPWLLNEYRNLTGDDEYEKYRNIFLDEYSKDIFPLVSILIPAYNRPDYLEIALNSALNQTYKNTEVIICDDSIDDRVSRMLKPYLKKINKIRYFKNENKLGKTTGLENAQKCYAFAKGEYINFLNDDDIFHKEKIERMVNYFMQYPDVTLVTSYRQRIDENGNNLGDVGSTRRLFNKDVTMDGIEMANYILKNKINVIGEPTTVLFRKKDLDSDFGMYNNRQYYPLSDVATWLSLLSKGKIVYICDALSYFRIHKGQNTNNYSNFLISTEEWSYLIQDSNGN